MRPVLTEPRPAPARRKRAALVLLGAGVAVASLMLVLIPAMESPTHVSRLVLDNPHEWAATVVVAGDEPDGWMGLGTVERQASHTFEEVLDQGDQWRFRFSYGGADGVEVVMSRSDLERRGWKVAVPDTFADRMRAAGVSPTGG